ncbi:MAG: nucleoside triphosphate pyrophosphohydrolase [FCB group bacterium]|nr:nucleoside triphosphate pyrophosphohydrolase [FCB group bacterium]
MKNHKAASVQFLRLISTLEKLRGANGCDWDRAQTARSLIPYLLEETYEVIEAIEEGNPDHLKEELGDLALHLVFQAQIASEQDTFDISDALDHISSKLIRRHPQVFGAGVSGTPNVNGQRWESIKHKENQRENFLDGVPKNLPALTRARRLQEKAANVGFDWKEIQPVWDKVHEELTELKEACAENDPNKMEDELGDVLFSLVNLGRFLKISSEEALRRTIGKFESRFRGVERRLREQGKSLEESSLEEMDLLWEAEKKTPRG